MAWDFWTNVPESLHQVSFLFSDRGTPDGFRHMNGYSSHTYKWVNGAGEAFWVKYTFKTDAGIKNLTADQAKKLEAQNSNYATDDLFQHIASGKSATWTWYVQIMPFDQGFDYKFDIFDITKVWPHSDYPLIPVGKMVLNRNPENYFAEVEQAAFAPTNLVPGIEPSYDKMLQARLFSYPDTHRHRLGPNFDQIPINCPYAAKVANYQRDGPMTVNGNQGSAPNYEPNTLNGPVADPSHAWHKHPIPAGPQGRHKPITPADDFEQVRVFYQKVLSENDRQHLVQNLVGHLSGCRKEIQQKAVKLFYKIDPDYGTRIGKGLGFTPETAKL